MKDRAILSKIFIAGALISSLTTAQVIASTWPGDLGYRFIHREIGVRDLTTHYGPDFAAAGEEYSNAAHITFFTSTIPDLSPPYSGDVAFSEENYGATGWMGIATAYNRSEQPCTDPTTGNLTGNCTLSNGADFAWIRFNTYYNPNSFEPIRHHLLRHEFGHVMGLSHASCTDSISVMAPGTHCSPMHTTLQTPEITRLHDWY